MTLGTWAAFLAAAAVGAPVRYLVDRFIGERVAGVFPWGTLAVNASGSLLAGFVAGLGLYHSLPSAPATVAGAGFCGAYTTFSTFAFETVRLLEEGAVDAALGNVAATVVSGAAAAAAGLALAAAL